MKILIVCAAILLVGCAGPESGVVIDKDHDAAWTQWHPGTTSCSGTPTRCTTTPGYMQYHPQDWDLRLRNGDDEGWRSVGEQAFNACQINDRYPECADPS